MGELAAADTVGILGLPGVAVERDSTGLGWEGLYLSVQCEQPYAEAFAPAGTHLLILHLDGPVEVTRGTGPAARTKLIGPGGMFIHPARRELSVALGDRLRTAHLYVRDDLVSDVAGGPVEIAEELGTTDPLLEHLILALDGAVRRWTPTGRAYVDHLGLALASHLALVHGAGPRAPEPERVRGLSDGELATVVDLMQSRLADPVSIDELARSVNLSRSQFARSFKERTGRPPHQHLIRLRLEHARRLLRTSDLRIADIAVRSGFAHQEHLTRAMSAHFGATPAVMRRALG